MTDNLTVLPKNLSNQNILITGAAGRIGSAIAKHALSLEPKFCLLMLMQNHLKNYY